MSKNYPYFQQGGLEQRVVQRRWVEAIVGRARHLSPADRALVEQVYQQGTSVTTLAHLAHKAPRAMHQRIHRILQRLTSQAFTFALEHMDLLSPGQRMVARLMILQGRSLRMTATQTH